MSDKPTTPSPFQITKRDLETVRYQNEPMRQASWTYPSVMLPGEDWPRVRQFALDTVMQMKQLYPEQFKGKTQQDWESALTNFIATRRPEFRAQVLAQLKGRYGEGKAMDPDLILTKAIEGFGKQAGLVGHIAGQAGSGKSFILRKLKAKFPTLVTKELDDFLNEIRKKVSIQQKPDVGEEHHALVSKFLQEHKDKPVVLGGIEKHLWKEIPPEKKWMPDTSPLLTAWRRYRRPNEHPEMGPVGVRQFSFWNLPGLYLKARESRQKWMDRGYTPLSAEEIVRRVGEAVEKKAEKIGYYHSAAPDDPIRRWLDKMKGEAAEKGYNLFAVAEHRNGPGASITLARGGGKDSAVKNARGAQEQWERRKDAGLFGKPVEKKASALTLQQIIAESKKDPWYGLGTAEKSKEIIPLRHEDRLVGYLRTGKTMKGDKTTGFVYVTPSERRKGVGSKALAELARVHPGVLSFVNEKNVASLGAHAKAGFSPTGERGKGHPENVILKKQAGDVFMDEIAKISGGVAPKMTTMSTVAGMRDNPKPLAVQRRLGFKPDPGANR